MTAVLDASAALAWLLHEPVPRTRAIVRDLVYGGLAVVPQLWSWEIANALVMAERRGRITADVRRRLAKNVDSLPITHAPPVGGVATLSELAASSGLTAYDACYLELALANGIGICSTDARLVAAARARGVNCVLDE